MGKRVEEKMQIPGQQRELVAKGFLHQTQSITNAGLQWLSRKRSKFQLHPEHSAEVPQHQGVAQQLGKPRGPPGNKRIEREFQTAVNKLQESIDPQDASLCPSNPRRNHQDFPLIKIQVTFPFKLTRLSGLALIV